MELDLAAFVRQHKAELLKTCCESLVSVTLLMYLSVCLSVSRQSLYLSVFLFLSVSAPPLPLSVSLSLSVALSVSLSLSVSVSDWT